MQGNSIINHKERLKRIIDLAYSLLCNKIAGKEIVIYNEASLQMQFGFLLKTIGKLYEFSPTDHFHIELESQEKISETVKSKNGARCDIKLSFFEGKQKTPKAKAFIELKYFRPGESESSTETFTDNRRSVLMDLQNLEHYQDEMRENNCLKPLCCIIVFAKNSAYCSPTRSVKYDIGEGQSIKCREEGTINDIQLNNNYRFHWEKCAKDQYWLKIII